MWEEVRRAPEKARQVAGSNYQYLIHSPNSIPVNAQMMLYLQDVKIGPALWFFLETHPEEALEMAELPSKK